MAAWRCSSQSSRARQPMVGAPGSWESCRLCYIYSAAFPGEAGRCNPMLFSGVGWQVFRVGTAHLLWKMH